MMLPIKDSQNWSTINSQLTTDRFLHGNLRCKILRFVFPVLFVHENKSFSLTQLLAESRQLREGLDVLSMLTWPRFHYEFVLFVLVMRMAFE